MRASRAIAGLIGLQLVLLLGYRWVESRRASPTAPAFAWEPLDAPAPPLSITRAGEAVAVPAGPHVVHFWATWCAPCRAELPGLLAAAEEADVALLAVTDEPWSAVVAWFGGTVPDAIVRDRSGDAAQRWAVSGLPDTFVVQGGRLTARVGGPRDWSTAAARRFLRGESP